MIFGDASLSSICFLSVVSLGKWKNYSSLGSPSTSMDDCFQIDRFRGSYLVFHRLKRGLERRTDSSLFPVVILVHFFNPLKMIPLGMKTVLLRQAI